MSSRENSITGIVAQYLRERDIGANTFESLEIPGEGVKEPDFTVRNEGTFYGEAKWSDNYNQGIVEATEYHQAPKSNGTFVIAYPEELKKEIKQQKLTSDVEEILGDHEFSVTFLRKSGSPDMRTVTIEEFPEWLNEQIHGTGESKTDVEEVVKVLRQTADALTQEMEDEDAMDLFNNVLGIDAREEEKVKAAKRVTGYLLVNQILFYRVLSNVTDFEPIEAESLSSPSDLTEYFDAVLEIDYTPIFSFSVASAYGQEHLPLIQDAVKQIYALNPEQIHHEVLGDVFHSLIPHSLRKDIAAFYTRNKAAHLLTGVAIEDGDAKILDPACGSGTLLTSAYRRKREFKQPFTRRHHHQFLENDITGIDVMPFAAHLSTIHLALQNPEYQSDNVRVGIEDSTKIQPGDTIQPLSYLLPESLIQRTLGNFDKSIEEFADDQKVERGAISRKGMEQAPLELEPADLVVMNPPYSRSEAIANFGDEYKDKLKQNRLRQYDKYIHGSMNFYAYFFLVADRFLKDGGRVAAVTSVGVLNILTDEGIRELLNRRYDIEYVFIRDDESSFSEDTDRREVMTIARKGEKQTATNFVRLKSLDVHHENVMAAAESLREGQSVERDDFSIEKVNVEKLNKNNLFAPFAILNSELLSIWENVVDSEKVTTLEETDPEIIRGAQAGAHDARGYNPEMSLNSPESYKFRDKDVWVLDDETDDTVTARHRFIEDQTFEISREKVVPNVRRLSGRWTADLTDLHEYAVIQRFEEFDEFEQLTKEDEIPVEDWESRAKDRLGHTAIARRTDFSAPGTAHMAFFSEEKRLWPGMMWVLTGFTNAESKILTSWFDSTFGWLQFHLDRVETRGAYAEWHKYIIEQFRVLNPRSIGTDDQNRLIEAVEAYGDLEVDSIVNQLARLSTEDDFNDDEREGLRSAFGDLPFGRGLDERRELDQAVMSALDVPSDERDRILETLYPALLKEILALKEMMDSD